MTSSDPIRTALARLVKALHAAPWTGHPSVYPAFVAAQAALAEPPAPSVQVAALADLVDDWRVTACLLDGDDPAVESARFVWGEAADELSALVDRLSGAGGPAQSEPWVRTTQTTRAPGEVTVWPAARTEEKD